MRFKRTGCRALVVEMITMEKRERDSPQREMHMRILEENL